MDPETGDRLPLSVPVVSLAIAAQFMSGHSGEYGSPVPLDRLLLAIGLTIFVVENHHFSWRPRPIHLLQVGIIGWCLGSLVWFLPPNIGSALFVVIDAVGVVPFIFFALAPVLFATKMRRDTLLLTLTLLGAYLGFVALLEGIGLQQFILPRYIDDPSATHYGRAMGPSLQVANNGLMLMGCGVAAAVLGVKSTRPPRRFAAFTVTALCGFGTLFTLTRSVWLGVAVGAVTALALRRGARRYLVYVSIATVVIVGSALLLDQGLRDSVQARLDDRDSAYDRINANSTAVSVVLARPLFGIGLGSFPAAEGDWLWQGDTIPIAATGIAVHNVFLGYAAELGLIGAGLWTACLMVAVLGAALSDSHRAPDLPLWRLAVLAYVVCWFVVANLVPITYPLPSSLLWVFLGIVSDPQRLGFMPLSRPREGGRPAQPKEPPRPPRPSQPSATTFQQ